MRRDIGDARSVRAEEARDCVVREQQLRARLPAVVADLRDAHPRLSGWLSRLTFALYRIRDLAKPPSRLAQTAPPPTRPKTKPPPRRPPR